MFLRVSAGVAADIGKSIDLSDKPEVLVGIAPGAHLQLTDPAWSQGRLRVERVSGTFRVTNEMGHTVTLGNENLGHGQQTVWFGGIELQATENTCLVLSATDEERAAGEGFPAWIIWLAFAVGVLVVLSVVAPDDESGGRVQSAQEARQEYKQLVDDLRDLSPDSKDRTVVAVLAEVQAGRFSEVRNQPNEAYRAYLSAREALDRAPPVGAREKETLERARAFVNARLTALAPRVKQRK